MAQLGGLGSPQPANLLGMYREAQSLLLSIDASGGLNDEQDDLLTHVEEVIATLPAND